MERHFTPGRAPARAVFLDRDGVVNRAVIRDGRPYAPASLDDFELLPGVPEAIEALHAAGFRILIATNQPDVAAGKQPRGVVEAIHARICRLLPIDAVKVCYHLDLDGCECRKPKPGMLLEAAAEQSIRLGCSVMVGDRWRDISAGHAAGCATILVGSGYGERFPVAPDAVVPSLREASKLILSGRLPWGAKRRG